MRYYETVSEAMNDLARRGYTTDFEISTGKTFLNSDTSPLQLSPDDFQIDETYRFEGNTDPGDEMIVFAISSVTLNLKGIIVNGYGMYADSATSALVEKLKTHISAVKPIRRNENMKSLSRDHHQALLLCWKIKTGLAKEISLERIKAYIDWFYRNHLLPHFELEEQFVFPVLGAEHMLVKQAIGEHREISALCADEINLSESIRQIQSKLEMHIRFEERILFNEIENNANEEQLKLISSMHDRGSFVDDWSDSFWQ